MISPHSTDAESYESTLALLGRVAPGMPADARSRAAWAISTAKLDLKSALAAENFNLHTAPTVPAPKPAPASPVTPPPPAPQRAQVAAAPVAVEKKPMTADDTAHLRLAASLMERAGAEGRATPETVAAFKERARAAAAETVENVSAAAIAAMEKNPKLSYYAAAAQVGAKKHQENAGSKP